MDLVGGEAVIEVFVAGGIVAPSQWSTKVVNVGVSESYDSFLCYNSEGWSTCKRRETITFPLYPRKESETNVTCLIVLFKICRLAGGVV